MYASGGSYMSSGRIYTDTSSGSARLLWGPMKEGWVLDCGAGGESLWDRSKSLLPFSHLPNISRAPVCTHVALTSQWENADHKMKKADVR